MSIRANGYYNDPALAQAASNLAAMFAPAGAASGTDASGYATADAKRAEMNRLGQYFQMSQDPNVDLETLSRVGTGLGLMNFTNNKYGVDQGNINNLEQRRLMEQGLTERQLLSPIMVNQDQKAFLPPELANKIDLPAILEGNRSPLTAEQVKGARIEKLAPELQDAIAFGSTPIKEVVTPDGVRNVTSLKSIGQEPYINKGAEAKPVNYQTPDGARGTATIGPTGQLVDTQTGQALPAGSVTFGTNIQGSETDTGLNTKTNQTRSVQIRGNVTNMNGLVTELEDLVANNPAATGLAGDILSFTQDAKQVVKELGQKFGGADGPISVDEVKAITDRILPETAQYNPVYRKAAALVFELAYANAKLNNPGGEVSRFALERELEQLGQGLVGNDKALMAVLDVSKGRMRRALDEADVLGGITPGITPDQIGQRTGGQPTGGQTTTRMKFDINGNLER